LNSPHCLQDKVLSSAQVKDMASVNKFETFLSKYELQNLHEYKHYGTH
jgi:hypothetical protein